MPLRLPLALQNQVKGQGQVSICPLWLHLRLLLLEKGTFHEETGRPRCGCWGKAAMGNEDGMRRVRGVAMADPPPPHCQWGSKSSSHWQKSRLSLRPSLEPPPVSTITLWKTPFQARNPACVEAKAAAFVSPASPCRTPTGPSWG